MCNPVEVRALSPTPAPRRTELHSVVSCPVPTGFYGSSALSVVGIRHLAGECTVMNPKES